MRQRTVRRALVAATVAAGLTAPTAQAKPGCASRACEKRVADKHCKRSVPVPCFRSAAIAERVPLRLLIAIGRCESGLRWWAENPSGAAGPMQFMPGTWRSTPFRAHSPFSMRWAPRAAAWLIRTDGVHHWNPSRGCWGGEA